MTSLKEWLIQHRIIEIELCGWGKACHLFLISQPRTCLFGANCALPLWLW
jgi:hypothetical protein